MSDAERKASEGTPSDWDDFPFDKQTVLSNIPTGAITSALHVSVSPTPPGGSVILRGRLANGRTRSVRVSGKIYAAKLPFADGTLRIQYLGDTKSVQLNLESYVLAQPAITGECSSPAPSGSRAAHELNGESG